MEKYRSDRQEYKNALTQTITITVNGREKNTKMHCWATQFVYSEAYELNLHFGICVIFSPPLKGITFEGKKLSCPTTKQIV